MKLCHDWIRQHFGLTTIHAVSKGPCPKPRIRSQACQNRQQRAQTGGRGQLHEALMPPHAEVPSAVEQPRTNFVGSEVY